MSKQLCFINPDELRTLGNILRLKTGTTDTYTISEMSQLISEQQFSGNSPSVKYEELTVTPSEESQTITAPYGVAYSPITIESIPDDYLNVAHCYTGEDAPNESLGVDGDLYIQF